MHRFCIAVLFIVERKDGSKLTFPTEIDADNELTERLFAVLLLNHCGMSVDASELNSAANFQLPETHT